MPILSTLTSDFSAAWVNLSLCIQFHFWIQIEDPNSKHSQDSRYFMHTVYCLILSFFLSHFKPTVTVTKIQRCQDVGCFIVTAMAMLQMDALTSWHKYCQNQEKQSQCPEPSLSGTLDDLRRYKLHVTPAPKVNQENILHNVKHGGSNSTSASQSTERIVLLKYGQ